MRVGHPFTYHVGNSDVDSSLQGKYGEGDLLFIRLRLGATVVGYLSRAKDDNSSFLDLIKANTKIPDGLEAPTREMFRIGKIF